MAGVKGRSGRRPKPLWAHLVAGTYRADRHGPLPAILGGPIAPAVRPVATPPPEELLAGLATPGRALVEAVYRDYEVTGPEVALLRAAAEAADRIAEVRAILAQDGLVVRSRGGRPMVHPLTRVEHQAVTRLVAALRALGLPAPHR